VGRGAGRRRRRRRRRGTRGRKKINHSGLGEYRGVPHPKKRVLEMLWRPEVGQKGGFLEETVQRW